MFYSFTSSPILFPFFVSSVVIISVILLYLFFLFIFISSSFSILFLTLLLLFSSLLCTLLSRIYTFQLSPSTYLIVFSSFSSSTPYSYIISGIRIVPKDSLLNLFISSLHLFSLLLLLFLSSFPPLFSYMLFIDSFLYFLFYFSFSFSSFSSSPSSSYFFHISFSLTYVCLSFFSICFSFSCHLHNFFFLFILFFVVPFLFFSF